MMRLLEKFQSKILLVGTLLYISGVQFGLKTVIPGVLFLIVACVVDYRVYARDGKSLFTTQKERL